MQEINQIFANCFEPDIRPVAKLLTDKLTDGHICIDLNDKEENSINIDKISRSPQLSVISDSSNYQIQPFVLYNNKIYLHRYFKYESTILNKIESLLSESTKNREKFLQELLMQKELIQNLFQKQPGDAQNDNWQLIAAIGAFLNNFSIITGGPGTGKTTTVSKLLALLFSTSPGMKVAIAAPTGKAAARINDTLKAFANKHVNDKILTKIREIKASSIHRLLGGYREFYFNEDNPLPFDVVIIDESSMIDSALMAKLLSAVPDDSRLIMLGDRNQLSSVEAGTIFGDFCHTRADSKNSFSKEYAGFLNEFIPGYKLTEEHCTSEKNMLTDCIAELEFSHRFDNAEGIGKFSKEVINSIDDNLAEYRQHYNTDAYLKILNPEEARLTASKNDFTLLIDTYKEYIEEQDTLKALKLLNKVKVLCAVREGKYGIKALNMEIEKYLGFKKGSGEFYENQAVLITVNNNEIGIFNGDIGLIRKDENGNKMAFFDINNELKAIPLMYITNYETAFAMTIHKSQGSEYEKVAVVLPANEQNKLLCRELLYTAVTRAKKQCFVYSTDEIIKKSISRKVKRVSGITERLKQKPQVI